MKHHANEGTATPRIGIVLSRFNETIGNGLLSACLAELSKLNIRESDVVVVRVPGALEVPLTLSAMARTGMYDGLIALGAVVRGETYHFEVVSNESARGITDVQILTGIPIANGILTTENDEQALARVDVKGRDCAQVVVEMIECMMRIDSGAA